MDSFYSEAELKKMNFKHLGIDVKISRKTSIYGISNISIGDHTRIDDFCILSGDIILGNYVHIAAYTALFAGKSGIILKDFCGMSSRCVIYAESEDYSGLALTNPTIPDKYRKISGEKVILHKHVIVGTGSTIMPGVEIGEGTSIGSMSLVTKSLESWGIYVGIPCKKIKDRYKNILSLEAEMINRKVK